MRQLLCFHKKQQPSGRPAIERVHLLGGLVNSQVQQAVTKLQQAQEQLSCVFNILRMQIHREYSVVKERIKRVEAFEVAVASAKQAVISNQRGVLAGTRVIVP